jgi:putative endonuclease
VFYVYLLKSLKNSDLYIGYTTDLKRRFSDHNNGFVRATKPNLPWKLIYYEAYFAKNDATKRERQLKMHKAKEDLKKQLKYSLSGLAGRDYATHDKT